ncbi:hypothetical protein C5167_039587 [Papaver somniferum]|uniref:Uncharacterized protein n=1 Tax=Papaver somniferum TaxID=3469 RepID=A0A4Y7ICI9_PAPSO|nr:hypothetical protein C5167_039587 [Papaver somniferum]
MGSTNWFKSIVRLKKVKKDKANQAKGINGLKLKNGNPRFLDLPVEDVAATRIQTAFRGYKARKTLRQMKKIVTFKALIQNQTVRKQSSSTLRYLHSWSKIQAEIRARRVHMVTEGRIKQKKLESQLKHEAKLHELEEEWCGGSDTMEEILSRIQQREDASIKRERAMAYAFSHQAPHGRLVRLGEHHSQCTFIQWRANSNPNHEKIAYEANWGWSWVERWIAARPWESRIVAQSISPKNMPNRPVSKVGNKKSPTAKKLVFPVKSTLSNGNGVVKVKKQPDVKPEKPVINEKSNSNGEVVSTSASQTEKTIIKQEMVS